MLHKFSESDSVFPTCSSLSLIINVVTKHTVSSKLEVLVSYGAYKDFNPYWFTGFAGKLARFQQAKQLLDDQVCGHSTMDRLLN